LNHENSKHINSGKTSIILCLATVISFMVYAQGNAQHKARSFAVDPAP